MPMLFVQTNMPGDKLPVDLNASLTDCVSKILSKPKQYIFVSIQHVPLLTFQGNNEPAALVELKSIGFGTKSKTVEVVAQCLAEKAKIPLDRIGMTLVDLKGTDVGIGGQTFG